MGNGVRGCARRGCDLELDEGGLCFAHKAEVLIDTLAAVMARRKVVQASAGGVSLTLHPEAFIPEYDADADEAVEIARRHEAETSDDNKPRPHDPSKPRPPRSLREEMNGRPVPDEILFGAAEGGTGLKD